MAVLEGQSTVWFLGVRVAKKDMVPTDTGWSNTLFTQTRDRTRSASVVHNGPAQTVPLSPQLTQVCMHPTCASGEEPHSLPPGQNTAVRIAMCTCFEHNKEELITPRTGKEIPKQGAMPNAGCNGFLSLGKDKFQSKGHS